MHFEPVTPAIAGAWIDSPRVRSDKVDLNGLCEDVENARRTLADLARLVEMSGLEEASDITGIGASCLSELTTVWASRGRPREQRVLLPIAIEAGEHLSKFWRTMTTDGRSQAACLSEACVNEIVRACNERLRERENRAAAERVNRHRAH